MRSQRDSARCDQPGARGRRRSRAVLSIPADTSQCVTDPAFRYGWRDAARAHRERPDARGHRRAGGGGRAWVGGPPARHRQPRRELHEVRRARPASCCGGAQRSVQDEPHPDHPARTRRADAVARCPCGKRTFHDQARITPSSGPALRVHVLHRFRGKHRGSPHRRCPGRPPLHRAAPEGARKLSRNDDEGRRPTGRCHTTRATVSRCRCT